MKDYLGRHFAHNCSTVNGAFYYRNAVAGLNLVRILNGTCQRQKNNIRHFG